MIDEMPGNNDLKDYLPDEATVAEIELSKESDALEIDPAQVLIEKSQAYEQFGISGDIVAILRLPGQGRERLIALVDFGNSEELGNPGITSLEPQASQTEINSIAQSRYGLQGLNYLKNSQEPARAFLTDNSTIVGRGREHLVGDDLGLSEKETDTMMISREHLRIDIQPNGRLLISDLSTNGTSVIKPADTSEAPSATESDTGDYQDFDDTTRVQAPASDESKPSKQYESSGESSGLTGSQQEALAELQNEWGWGESVSLEEANFKLANKLEELKKVDFLLTSFDQTGHALRSELTQTLNNGGVVYLKRSTHNEVQDFISRQSRDIINIALSQPELLPPSVRAYLSEETVNSTFISFERNYNAMTEKYSQAMPIIDTDIASTVINSLEYHIPEVQRSIKLALHYLETMSQKLNNKEAQAESQADSSQYNEVKYRDDHVKEWADELKGDVSPERLDEIIESMKNSIDIEANMIDDPNSPMRWFGQRILEVSDDNLKERARTDITKRQGKVASRQYVAELMADMLSGNFNLEKTAGDDILLNSKKVGGVELGMHRVAALAMIYGKDWQTTAKKLGFKIIEK